MPARVSGVAVAEVTAGLVLAWSGIKGATLADTLTSLLKGQSPAKVPEASPDIVIGTPASDPGSGSGGSAPAGSAGSTAPAAPSSLSASQGIAKLQAAAYGWSTGAQWNALVALWNKESGWSNTADTRKSGLDPPDASVFAYGIPQARPYSKMPKSAWPPDKGGSSSATAQIAWGLSYIKGTYGSAEAAWAHEEAEGWY